LVYDKESGQPKGYGFLEFTDSDAAASAVRNLNSVELNGRQLRVDYSNDNRSGLGQPPASFSNQSNGKPDPAALPPLPQGTDLPPGVTIFDGISQTLAAVPTATLLDFISQLKGLCQSNPAQATALLQKAPQLGYAVFQAMCLLGLVDPNIVAQLIQSQGLAPPPPQQQAAPAPPPSVAAQYPPQPPQPQYGQFPPPPQAYGNAYAPTPPTQHNAYQPPAPQAPPPQQPQAPPGQEDLIRQVLALTAEQIYAMDPSARDQIIALRAQFGAPL
jgi:cleavage stimulation factor subunit 2